MEKLCSKCGKGNRHITRTGRTFSWCKKCISDKEKHRYWSDRKAQLERRKEWQRKNRDKVKEIRRKTTFKIKVETLIRYGGKCKCCGETEYKFLAIDHINNDGARQRKELKKTRGATGSFYYWLKKNNYPKGYQVLCHNCNMAKAFYKICPHQE